MPLPNGLLQKLCTETGVTCAVDESETWQPFMCRQDQLREIVRLAYQAGRNDLTEESAAEFERNAA